MGKYNSSPRNKNNTTLTVLLALLVLVLLVLAGALFLLMRGDSATAQPKPVAQITAEPQPTAAPAANEPETTQPEQTNLVVAASGEASQVQCRADYTVSAPDEQQMQQVVATAGSAELTNQQLQVLYLSAVSAYRASGSAEQPDYARSLAEQPCPLGDGSLSWQHYFLQETVNGWQVQQAALYAAAQPVIITEPEFQPTVPKDNHEDRIKPGMPVNDFLYQNQDCFKPNKLHQAWLDSLNDRLDEAAAAVGYADAADLAAKAFGSADAASELQQAAADLNRAYMFFTEMSYGVNPTDEEAEAYADEHQGQITPLENTVDIRHVLVIPEGASVAADGKVTATDEQWEACRVQAETLRYGMADIKNAQGLRINDPKNTEDAMFANLANRSSQDEGSRINGGCYYNIRPGQLTEALNEWCFSPDRYVGESAVIRSDVGYHIVYLRAFHNGRIEAGREVLRRELEQEAWQTWMQEVPLKPDYSAVALWVDPTADFSLESVLYPDVAHERFPEAIVYLQQDYFYTPWGTKQVGKNGCGVATMAMLATYMTDTYWTPADVARTYDAYFDNSSSSTNGDIFRFAPAEMGFFWDRMAFDTPDVIAALENGQRVISLQVKGHFTSSGHYLLLQAYNRDDDTYEIRDSNVFNYGLKPGHNNDRHASWTITSGGAHFYLMQRKITAIPACDRCGGSFEDHGPAALLTDYTCEKCAAALSRRSNFLDLMASLSQTQGR